MDGIIQGFELAFSLNNLLVMIPAAAYGIFMGAIPGLTAVMAMSLLVPFAIFMDPIPALAAILACGAMAIFAGDIPATLMRIPGTPASAAYTDDCYALTRNGQAELALGCNVWFSAIGGIIGTIVLIVAAPLLAEVALNFSSYEYFWLASLGLTCATFIGGKDPMKGALSLFFGLAITTVGLDITSGQPRYTFGVTELLGGLGMIPILIGLFAVSEVLRRVVALNPSFQVYDGALKSNIFRGVFSVGRKYFKSFLQGNMVGVIIGALPGAGADIAAWISYAISKRLSKTPEKFGKGSLEGIVGAGSANNSALASAWIPALVFGIPGDVTTSIVIGLMYIKDINPGPTVFIQRPEIIYGVYFCFILANVLMLFFGYFAIKAFKHILRIPTFIMMPIILVFCIVGAFAINNSLFDVGVMLVFGLIGYLMEENDFPIAPLLLAMVIGNLLEQNFMTSMIKSGGDVVSFFNRPIAGALGVFTVLFWVVPPVLGLFRRLQSRTTV